MLNTGDIPEDADAPGLDEAREKLKIARMTKAELNAYYRHLDNVVILRDNIETATWEGKMEGRAEEKYENARKMKELGSATDFIQEVTGLTTEEIEKL